MDDAGLIMARIGSVHRVRRPIPDDLDPDNVSEHDAFVRAAGLIDWMMIHVGRMCPPADGLFDLNEHSMYVDRQRARGDMPLRKKFIDGRPPDQHAPGATPMRPARGPNRRI